MVLNVRKIIVFFNFHFLHKSILILSWSCNTKWTLQISALPYIHAHGDVVVISLVAPCWFVRSVLLRNQMFCIHGKKKLYEDNFLSSLLRSLVSDRVTVK